MFTIAVVCDSYWQELERRLEAKEASLRQEPASDDEKAVTLLVRMPDGSRRGRRFLKSDKLQVLFRQLVVVVTFSPIFLSTSSFQKLEPDSDNFLQSLFDFIDIGRGVKPGSYRLVSKSFF